MAGRRQQRVCQRTVVRDQKQSLGVEIQPSHREQISSCGVAQIIHHRAVHIVLCRRHTAGGLVKQIILKSGIEQALPAQAYLITCLIDLLFRLFCNRSVHGDQTGFDLFFYLASGSCAQFCQIFIQTKCHFSPSLSLCLTECVLSLLFPEI